MVNIAAYNPADFDTSKFSNTPTSRFTDESWGRMLHFTEIDAPYAGREWQIRENQTIETHISDTFRTFYLREGKVVMELENADGEIVSVDAATRVGYRIQPGQKFGFRTTGFAKIVEAAMPTSMNGADKAQFTIDGYVKRVEKPWGYELHWAKEFDPLMAKIIHINEYCRLSEQVHDVKEETYLNIWGNGQVVWDNNELETVTTPLVFDKGYRTFVGQKHRLGAMGGGVDILEISTPEAGTTWRLADDYSRPHETEEQRKIERGEL